MKVTFTEYKQSTTEIDDLEKWWIEQAQKSYEKTDKYWLECLEKDEPYCYGRNEVNRNLYYAENSRFTMKHSWVPNDVWKEPNIAFFTLLKKKGLI